jgi:Rrf2 family protein
MSSLIKVSDAAVLALHAMAYLVGGDAERVSTRQIAADTGVSENHLAKVMAQLEKAGLVIGTRGPKGGFELAKAPARITLGDIYEAVEGPLRTTRCLFGRPICDGACMLGGLLCDVDATIRQRLTTTRLSDLATSFKRTGKAV